MGACNFRHVIDAYSAREGFDRLVSEAIYDYGNDGYNGTISTCELGFVKNMSASGKYTEAVMNKAEEYIVNDNYGEKWVATCLDLGIVAYDIFTAKKKTPEIREKAEYRQKFAVFCYDDNGIGEISEGYRDTKKEADELALKLTLQNGRDYFVAKRPVKINRGDDTVTQTTYTVKRKKTEPKSCPKNSVVKPVHKYIFYGMAAC